MPVVSNTPTTAECCRNRVMASAPHSAPHSGTGSAGLQANDLDAALKPATSAHLRPEVVIARIRRHGRRLTFPVLVLLIVAPLTGFYASWLSEVWQQLSVLGGAAFILVAFCLFPYLAWLGTTFTVTTKRIIVRRGFFVRSRSEASIGRIREVRLRANAIQRMYGSGTVQLLIGSDNSLSLIDVPHAELTVSMLHELIERSYAVQTSNTFPPTAGFTPQM